MERVPPIRPGVSWPLTLMWAEASVWLFHQDLHSTRLGPNSFSRAPDGKWGKKWISIESDVGLFLGDVKKQNETKFPASSSREVESI